MGSVLSVTAVDGNVTWGLKSLGVLHGGVCVLPVTEIDECVTRGVCCL